VVPIPDNHEARRAFLDATVPHLDAVWSVARQMTADRSSAEDLVQETFLRLSGRSPTSGMPVPGPGW